MTDGLSREEFRYALEALQRTVDRGFSELNGRLDVMNGQVRDHGESIAVLEDRDTRDNPARITGVVGLFTAVAGFIYQHFVSKP